MFSERGILTFCLQINPRSLVAEIRISEYQWAEYQDISVSGYEKPVGHLLFRYADFLLTDTLIIRYAYCRDSVMRQACSVECKEYIVHS